MSNSRPARTRSPASRCEGPHPVPVDGSGLPRDEASVLVRPFVEATEAAIAELTAELHHMTAHVLRMARARLGLC